MEETLKIDEFKNYIDNGDFETIYKIIIDRSVDLAKKIATKKKINLSNLNIDKNIKDTLYNIMNAFKEQSASFESVSYLMSILLDFDIDIEDDLFYTEDEKLKKYIRVYNSVIYELKAYEKVEEDIKEYGYENLRDEKINKLIELFKEMLEYKNKPYKKDFDFEKFVEKIYNNYHIYHEILTDTLNHIKLNTVYRKIDINKEESIKTNNVENILALNTLYEILSDKEDGYKNYAYFYRDFELEDGMTYNELYNKEIEKFVKLFKDMLDFLNVKYNTNDIFSLIILVKNNYPYYTEILMNLSVTMKDPNLTYIMILDTMEDIYDNLSKNYKNHKENMEKYEKKLKEEENEDDMFQE